MSERRTLSLLDFAIAASTAVVPIMLGVLLLVAVIRPADLDTPRWREAPDRYVSVRHIAALKTFEAAIVPRHGSDILSVSAGQVLDSVPGCRREWRAAWHPGAWLAPIGRGDAATPEPAERVAAQLVAFDEALQRFSTRANTRVGGPVGLDAARWFEVAQKALGTPIEAAGYPGQHFQLVCADLAAALTALTRADARMLDSLAWRGSEGGARVARWRADQQMEVMASQFTRRNPWAGVAGCIYLGRRGDAVVSAAPTHFIAAAGTPRDRLCAMPAMAGGAAAPPPVALGGPPGLADALDDSRWMVPPSLLTLLQPLEPLRRPSGALYQLYTEHESSAAPGPAEYRYGPNRIALDGNPVEVGFSVDLTIDPSLQALAQKTAACYTGRHDVCLALGMRRAEDKERPIGQQLLEGAMVRMAAVAMVDVASGRIEALAGALSPCARQEVDGPGRDAGCDKRVPYPVGYRPDALLNPAVFHDAMPASTIKPIIAAALLSEPDVGARWLAAERAAMKSASIPPRDSLRGQLMRSDSARFLDRMFCSERHFNACRRPWSVQAAAAAFGWNAGCDAGRIDCGKVDLLFGRAVDASAEAGVIRPRSTLVAYGRLMSEPVAASSTVPARTLRPGAAMHLMPPAALDPVLVRACAAGADGRRLSDDDWEKCRGGALVDVVAEGWGQGHARASALGVAGMMAALAAAANGQAELRRPHLVESLHGVGASATLDSAATRWGLAAPQPNLLSPDAAAVILSGLSYSHRAGTARSACEQVFDARRCREMAWLAGKTGTPSFPGDGVSLDQLARRCEPSAASAATRPAACNALRPYKWYVAAYRADAANGGPWTKVIAVLAERNWLQRSGQVHGAGDHGPNPAAEIALQIAGRQVGVITGSAP